MANAKIKLTDFINLENLQKIQDAYSNSTQIASVILDINDNQITKPSNSNIICELISATTKGAFDCKSSKAKRLERSVKTKEPFYRQCKGCGFVDASIPIFIGDEHVANWLLGQTNSKSISKDRLVKYASKIGADQNKIEAAFGKLPVIPMESFLRHLDLLHEISKEIINSGNRNLQLKKIIEEGNIMEKTFRESEEKYKSVLEQSADNFFFMDSETLQVVEANPTFMKFLGYTEEEMLNLTGYDFIDHDRDDIDDKVKNIMAKNKYYLGERRYRRKDGVVVDVDVTASRVEYQNKSVVFIVSRDITEKKKFRTALKESEKKYRELFRDIYEGIGILDENDIISLCNPAFATLFGYKSESELIGRSIFDFVPSDQVEILHFQTNLRKQNKKSSYELDILTTKNEKKTIFVTVVPIFDDDKYTGSFGTVIDITERKITEKALQDAHKVLEERVIKRTKQLADANKELLLERETLERKNVALQELLDQIEDGKRKLASQIQLNINNIAIPIMTTLKDKLRKEDQYFFDILRESLADIASPFLSKLEAEYTNLTPREIELCNMIKSGLSSKEIAKAQSKSEQTVLKQRKTIRKKLGIAKKRINLVSYLKSLEYD